mgnify:FL=1
MYDCFPTGCSYIAIQISDMTGSMQGCAYSYEALLAGYSRTLYITKGVIIKKEGEIECSKNISSRVVFRGKRALPPPPSHFPNLLNKRNKSYYSGEQKIISKEQRFRAQNIVTVQPSSVLINGSILGALIRWCPVNRLHW